MPLLVAQGSLFGEDEPTRTLGVLLDRIMEGDLVSIIGESSVEQDYPIVRIGIEPRRREPIFANCTLKKLRLGPYKEECILTAYAFCNSRLKSACKAVDVLPITQADF